MALRTKFSEFLVQVVDRIVFGNETHERNSDNENRATLLTE